VAILSAPRARAWSRNALNLISALQSTSGFGVRPARYSARKLAKTRSLYSAEKLTASMSMPIFSAAETASTRSSRVVQCSSSSSSQFFMKSATTSWPARFRSSAATAESTPPDMPTTIFRGSPRVGAGFMGPIIGNRKKKRRGARPRLPMELSGLLLRVGLGVGLRGGRRLGGSVGFRRGIGLGRGIGFLGGGFLLLLGRFLGLLGVGGLGGVGLGGGRGLGGIRRDLARRRGGLRRGGRLGEGAQRDTGEHCGDQGGQLLHVLSFPIVLVEGNGYQCSDCALGIADPSAVADINAAHYTEVDTRVLQGRNPVSHGVPLQVGRARLPPLARVEPLGAPRPHAGAEEAQRRQAHGRRHAAHLAVAALPEDELDPRGGNRLAEADRRVALGQRRLDPARQGGQRGPVVQEHAARQGFQRLAARLALDLHPVRLRELRAR